MYQNCWQNEKVLFAKKLAFDVGWINFLLRYLTVATFYLDIKAVEKNNNKSGRYVSATLGRFLRQERKKGLSNTFLNKGYLRSVRWPCLTWAHLRQESWKSSILIFYTTDAQYLPVGWYFSSWYPYHTKYSITIWLVVPIFAFTTNNKNEKLSMYTNLILVSLKQSFKEKTKVLHLCEGPDGP